MAIQWSVFRNHIRRSILKDTLVDVTKRKWSDDQLMDMAGWALDVFAIHTAAVTSVEIPLVSGTLAYDLPDNLFESPEIAGAVYTVSSDSVRQYYKPYLLQPVDLAYGYYVENNQLVFLEAPESNPTLLYYAYWNKPLADSSSIDVPNWALPALANLIGSYAMSPEAVPTTNIRRFAEEPEKGTPLDNPYILQQNQFLKMYDYITTVKVKPQNRQLFTGFE